MLKLEVVRPENAINEVDQYCSDKAKSNRYALSRRIPIACITAVLVHWKEEKIKDMNEENLKLRLVYFEQRLEEAKRKHAAKEPHPRSFDQGYTKEILKSWPESIALIKERILCIEFELRGKFSNRPAGAGKRKGYDAAL